ncbi:MAG: hypothetical protein IT381_06345 [Deltaproteobacteria bacterium]|nr:hypothetical protein [Deltaproteobacteria bacterium]
MTGAVRATGVFLFLAAFSPGCLFIAAVIPAAEEPVSCDPSDPACTIEGVTGETGVTGPTNMVVPAGAIGDPCANDGACTSLFCDGTMRCAAAPTDTCPAAPRDPLAPVLFFTDLVSGPNSGGEDNLGVFITIYGERFGATAGTVLINGAPVAKIKEWTPDSGAARGIDRIVVQPGSSVTSGNLVVIVAGRVSNPLPFTVRSGRIFLLDPASTAATATGSFSEPFKTLSAAKSVLAAGDTVYIKDGVFDTRDPDSIGVGRNTYLYLSRSNYPATTPQTPVAIVGYPGHRPTFGPPTFPPALADCMGGTTAVSIEPDNSQYVQHLVFAHLNLKNSSLLLAATGNGLRFVDLVFDTECAHFHFGDPQANTGWLLGSNFHGTGPVTSMITLESYGTSTIRDIELGWNENDDTADCFWLFGANQQGSSTIQNITIHDNLVRKGFRLASFQNNVQNIAFYNNVALDTGPWLPDDFTGTATLTHNSFFGVERLFSFVGVKAAMTHVVSNNIFALTNGAVVSADNNVFSGASNLWRNQAIPPFDATGFSDAPGFVDATIGDLRLQPASPARARGAQTTRCATFDGVRRPTSSAPDVGAY